MDGSTTLSVPENSRSAAGWRCRQWIPPSVASKVPPWSNRMRRESLIFVGPSRLTETVAPGVRKKVEQGISEERPVRLHRQSASYGEAGTETRSVTAAQQCFSEQQWLAAMEHDGEVATLRLPQFIEDD